SLGDRGYAATETAAVLADDKFFQLGEIEPRLLALRQFAALPEAAALAAANKRVGNILKKSSAPVPAAVDASLLREPAEAALEAIARLNHAGWHTVIASNQSGLARGLFDMAALNAIHARMNRELAEVGGRIDAIFFCPHGPEDGCRCRKPLPGMFETIADRY